MSNGNNGHKQELPTLEMHLYLYAKLKAFYPDTIILTNEEIRKVLNRTFMVPKKTKDGFLKEMEKMNLMRKVNKQKWQIVQRKVREVTDSYGNPLW